jgi:hypothetical protein
MLNDENDFGILKLFLLAWPVLLLALLVSEFKRRAAAVKTTLLLLLTLLGVPLFSLFFFDIDCIDVEEDIVLLLFKFKILLEAAFIDMDTEPDMD